MCAVKVGKNAKVTVGANTVAEMGTWSLDGITNELLDATAFGDEYKEYAIGVGDWGGVSFNGSFDMTDTDGQLLLDSAHKNKTVLNSIRLYIDSVNYYTPNITTAKGGLASAGVLMQTIAISFDKSGIGTISFSAKCTGPWTMLPSASLSPSASPSVSPSVSPSGSPSVSPSASPSASPSVSPSASPSASPST